jgi:glycosyltransferase involved in cell wall biosynthesis
MALPKVSIVIPSYKPLHFEQCLRSAIGQTYPNTEILVSDNCPTEEIRDICKRFPDVIYQRCAVIRDGNIHAAFYSGKGTYIKPLFDDDILHPFCVERMVAAMEAHRSVQMVFSVSQVIDTDNLRVETRRAFEATGSMPGLQLHRNMVLGMRNFIGEFSTVMFTREKLWQIGHHNLFKVGGHDCTRGLSDVASYCNLVEGGDVFYIDEELSYFRRDPRLQSESNPTVNKNFGYCFSDYFELLMASHRIGVVSTEELLGAHDQVQGAWLRLRDLFFQVEDSYQRYLSYCAAVRGDAHA